MELWLKSSVERGGMRPKQRWLSTGTCKVSRCKWAWFVVKLIGEILRGKGRG